MLCTQTQPLWTVVPFPKCTSWEHFSKLAMVSYSRHLVSVKNLGLEGLIINLCITERQL